MTNPLVAALRSIDLTVYGADPAWCSDIVRQSATLLEKYEAALEKISEGVVYDSKSKLAAQITIDALSDKINTARTALAHRGEG